MSNYLPPGGRFVEGGREYQLTCPQCGKPKFHWSITRAYGSCFACRFGVGSIRKFQEVFGEFSSSVTAPSPTLQTKTATTGGSGDVDERDCLLYLSGRGVGPDLAREAGLRYESQTARVIAPVWSPLGLPASTMARSIDPRHRGWMFGAGRGSRKGLHLFGSPPRGASVVLVEGVFDLLSPGLYGVGLALLGSSIVVDLEVWLIRRYQRILLWLDPDTKENGKRSVMLARFRAYGREVIEIDDVEPGSEYEPERSQALLRANQIKEAIQS